MPFWHKFFCHNKKKLHKQISPSGIITETERDLLQVSLFAIEEIGDFFLAIPRQFYNIRCCILSYTIQTESVCKENAKLAYSLVRCAYVKFPLLVIIIGRNHSMNSLIIPSLSPPLVTGPSCFPSFLILRFVHLVGFMPFPHSHPGVLISLSWPSTAHAQIKSFKQEFVCVVTVFKPLGTGRRVNTSEKWGSRYKFNYEDFSQGKKITTACQVMSNSHQ